MAKTRKKTTKKVCKAVNQKDKCIVYKAEHKLKKAADAHGRAIRKRGGKVKRKAHPTKNAYIIEYSFPKKKK